MQFFNAFNDVIRQNPVLKKDIQISLIRDWKTNNNKEALDKVILSNMRAVVKEAYKVKRNNPYLSCEDLVQEGMCGLIKAVDLFDEDKDAVFLTYAMWWR
jgi:DNA-directed RNA polymerase sigma subunit (sigma70/sigma32)